jgi:hypothetical protein
VVQRCAGSEDSRTTGVDTPVKAALNEIAFYRSALRPSPHAALLL